MDQELVTASADPSPVVKDDPQVKEAATKVDDDAPKKTPTRLEALEKALKNAGVEDEKPAEKEPEKAEKPAEIKAEPAKAKAPDDPEKAEVEKPAADKSDDPKKAEAKAEPSKEEAKEDEGQPRNPDGTFAAKEAEKASDAPETKKDDGPPARFSADAKAEWEKAPPAVRGEALRAVREMESGLQQKDEQISTLHSAISPLVPFIEEAQKHGRHLHEVVSDYFGMEQLLGQDKRAGMTRIAANFGQTLPEFLEELTGEAQEHGSADRELLGLRQQVNEMNGVIAGLNQQLQAIQGQGVERTLEEFAASHPRFDELMPHITRLMETGYAQSLDEAYATAELLNPAPTPAQPAPPPPQTRPLKSVTGAPTAGSDPVARKPSKTRQEAIGRAFSAVNL